MNNVQLKISGMKCGGCVSTVESILKNYDGLENVSVNLLTESAYFEINKSNNDIEKILSNLQEKGFPAEIYIDDFSEKINKAEIKKEINILTIFGSGTSVINCSPKNMAIRLTKKLTAPNV